VRLTHELLGGLVGAQRAPVTRALGRLRNAGVIRRRQDGSWLLQGEPPSQLPELHVRAAGAAEPTGSAAPRA
jgi:DNA-binding GntR family transcriptional regulator